MRPSPLKGQRESHVNPVIVLQNVPAKALTARNHKRRASTIAVTVKKKGVPLSSALAKGAIRVPVSLVPYGKSRGIFSGV